MDEDSRKYTKWGGIGLIWLIAVMSIFVEMPWDGIGLVAGFLITIALSGIWYLAVEFISAKPDGVS